MIDFKQLSEQYKHELLDRVIPFWIEKSQDRECGGYFTCLERDGSVFDTDKFVWMQGREVWMLSMLYNKVEHRQEWLDAAVQGAEFMRRYAHDGQLNWYFSLTREGQPLVEPYNIFSYTFATMAFGQLAIATGNDEYARIARDTFDIILSRVDNPKGRWNKAHPGTRPMKNFALPMILCNLALEIEPLLDPAFLQQCIDTCIHEVMDVFVRPELGGLVVENVALDGSLVDTMDGRHMNPGHAIEAMWFIMDLGKRLNRPDLIERAKDTALRMADYGWDSEYGGIFYFMDRLGRPTQELEWDQKLWWVHIETLIAMIKGYRLTSDPRSSGSSACTTMCGRTSATPSGPSGSVTSTAAARCCSRSRAASGRAASMCRAGCISVGKCLSNSRPETSNS